MNIAFPALIRYVRACDKASSRAAEIDGVLDEALAPESCSTLRVPIDVDKENE